MACFVDVVLAVLLNAVRVDGNESLSSLLPARIAARGLWFTGPAVLWITARPIAAWFDNTLEQRFSPAPLARALIWKLVALLMIIVPLLLLLAGWAAALLRVTLAGSWAFEGPLFLTPAFYSTSILATAPAVLAGTTLHAISRHLDPE